jgi:hypothetical protein
MDGWIISSGGALLANKKNQEKAQFRQMLAEILEEDSEVAYQDREFNKRYRYATTNHSTQRSRSCKNGNGNGNNANYNGNYNANYNGMNQDGNNANWNNGMNKNGNGNNANWNGNRGRNNY